MFKTLLLFSLVWLFVGCADLPRDQHGATARIREGGEFLVGISDERFDSAEMEAREKMLVEKVAAHLNARIVWRRGNAHHLLQDLVELKLPLVAANIPCDSPFADRVGMSQPYFKDRTNDTDYCLTVAPGENRLLLLVDQTIAEERSRGQ
jgi:hypothetical protein